MRLLLDTQVMLWWLLDDPRLGPETRGLLQVELQGKMFRTRELQRTAIS